ncbi:hypothetical protein AC1031_012366 [Aphanomyces cochlioides]|nr:hypothetical protein AC1031_012366 [Aphanomyces cochlioides]
MRIVLFLVLAVSVVLGWGHPLDHQAHTRRVNRFLTGKYERRWRRKGGNNGEIVGGGAGNALGTAASAALGTLTGGNLGTRAGRSGLAAGARITGEYLGSHFGAKIGGFAGRQADKLTKTGRQTQAAAKNAKKQQAEALKKPVLYTGGEYQKAKLSRTGSSPALLQRTRSATSGSKASTSVIKSPINVDKASTLRKRKL